MHAGASIDPRPHPRQTRIYEKKKKRKMMMNRQKKKNYSTHDNPAKTPSSVSPVTEERFHVMKMHEQFQESDGKMKMT